MSLIQQEGIPDRLLTIFMSACAEEIGNEKPDMKKLAAAPGHRKHKGGNGFRLSNFNDC